ncbi:DUF418 domain-containing protein [Polyangium sp. 6x1]|uniref:DUF418 domain-containing protein n=1 Tax=Polyangium sp. 6x1 TaxID=3042689 RepID=UPI00248317C2|nr:DUF418 domain-containing protein [Polyangium sp. 6x1]MDI1451492.1 DUF418 domain-containing protein [Polyangium sp. 6x1]
MVAVGMVPAALLVAAANLYAARMMETGQGEAEPTKTNTTELAPVAAVERVVVLDVLRGFALYGVLLANTVPWFSARAFMPREVVLARTNTVDRVFLYVLGLFVNGKAMALLTMLFGLGFAVQLERAEARGRSVVPLHVRRLAAMALLGVSHVVLLWWGDVMWEYALAGFGLLFFRRVRGWKLLAWGLFLLLVPLFVFSIHSVAEAYKPYAPAPPDFDAFRAQMHAAIVGSDRRLLTVMHVKQALYFSSFIWPWYFAWLVGRYLLGAWAGTTRIFHDAEARLPFFRKLLGWGLGLGLLGSAIQPGRVFLQRSGIVIPELVGLALIVPSELGVVLLTAGYAAAVVLLMQRPAWRRALLCLAPAGQMPLSTYLGQSLLSTFVYYGWGLGLAGRFPAWSAVPITLCIFTLQVIFARAWLSRFRFGPMEWVWRSMTYGRLQPLRLPARQEELA